MTLRRNSSRTGRRALESLTPPARQEVLGALGEGPATVRVLAERLGRSRQALYHHLDVLERAGLVRVTGEVGEGPVGCGGKGPSVNSWRCARKSG